MNKGTTKRMIVMLVIAGILIAGVIGFQTFKTRMIAKAILGHASPPQTVATAVAKEERWKPTVQAIGNLRASQQASLGAEVGGLVTAIHFKSGAAVRAGQALVELDPAPLRAQLAQLQAQADLAALNLKRDRAQLAIHAISQAVVDTDAATVKQLQAQISAQKALIAQKTITAPFSGRLGLRQVDLGQVLAAGTPVVTLQALDPMDVDFNVPQAQAELVHIGMTATLRSSGAPGRVFAARVIALEPQVDPGTRNIKVRARLSNPGGKLLPGMFADLELSSGAPRDYVTLPNAAIAYNPYGATVFVVEQAGKGPDGKPAFIAKQRFVTPGPTRGDQVAILQGLTAGETVVTAGQLKLRNGTTVLIDNKVKPGDSPNPQVPNS